jgi:hypothetical protein
MSSRKQTPVTGMGTSSVALQTPVVTPTTSRASTPSLSNYAPSPTHSVRSTRSATSLASQASAVSRSTTRGSIIANWRARVYDRCFDSDHKVANHLAITEALRDLRAPLKEKGITLFDKGIICFAGLLASVVFIPLLCTLFL